MTPGEKRREAAQLRALTERAAALMAALFLLLALLVFAALGKDALAAVEALSEPIGVGIAAFQTAQPEAAHTPVPEVTFRLADVDTDVGPEVIIRLIRIENGEADPLPAADLTGDEPTVLVYHTHDTEAYRPVPGSEYEPSGDFRTEDDDYNVYAVGEELCRVLREEYGIIAIHAPEKHEKPLITTAYSRSLETMLRYKEEYPTLEMFIDLHRDGVADTGYEDDCVTVEGKECARMMFVVGTGKSGKSSQYGPEETEGVAAQPPDFESNYALAVRLTETLLSYNDRFMRNIRVKSGKYNQQVSSQCLLVEVGHNGNTLEQAKNAAAFLAKAIAELGDRG